MFKNIYVFWYKLKERHGNFGDELNPYIINKISSSKVRYLPIADTKIRRLLKGLKSYLKSQITTKDLWYLLASLKTKKYYVAIGSVLESVGGRNCHVWGAGIIRRKAIIRKANFHAVRGEVTRTRLKELGYKQPDAIGDPALLLPLIYVPEQKKQYELGIIPHFIHQDEINQLDNLKNEKIIIIDLLDDIETVVDKINLCKRTISSSLHGIIVSHAYGIPSIWCNLSRIPLAGDNVKFADYFSSVEIPAYNSINITLDEDILEQVDAIFRKHKDIAQVRCNLEEIQRKLLYSAPFNIKLKYKSLK